MIQTTITDQIKDAMRAKDSVRLETLRYVLSQIKYAQIDKHRELTDDEIIGVLSNEVKKRRDAIQMFKDSGRTELVDEENTKLAVIVALLPAQLSTEEITALVKETIAASEDKSFGSIMKQVSAKTRGKADGKMVSEVVKQQLA